ncbi:MAG: TIGR00730 family Rossman fold protein [Bacteroidota bacterium]
MSFSSLCIFCGSNPGKKSVYADGARALGSLMAEQKIKLVYGGGKIGLMGIIADTLLEKGGEVIGVIPDFLMKKEVGHTGIQEMHVVKTMHERKYLMSEIADGFIAMPGGFGTLDELAEILTWAQLGLHQKPIGILNIDGYFDGLLSFVDTMVKEGYLVAQNSKMILVDDDPKKLLEKMATYTFPDVEKWLNKDQL